MAVSLVMVSPLACSLCKERGPKLKETVIKSCAFNFYIYISIIMVVVNAVSHSNMIYEVYTFD